MFEGKKLFISLFMVLLCLSLSTSQVEEVVDTIDSIVEPVIETLDSTFVEIGITNPHVITQFEKATVDLIHAILDGIPNTIARVKRLVKDVAEMVKAISDGFVDLGPLQAFIPVTLLGTVVGVVSVITTAALAGLNLVEKFLS